MPSRIWPRLLALTMLLLLALGLVSALAASNTVPVTHVGSVSRAITVPELAPPECASIAAGLTDLIVGGGTIDGDNGNSLILGSPGDDLVRARQGNDCVVGGGGNDDLRGNQGTDVLVGGPGNDALNGGQGQDICYGGPGTDTAQNCETTYDVP
jgi:RTX calcium-binding nonapeptide repeat (4 copies)